MTRQPYFRIKQYQKTFRGYDTKIFQIFGVPIGNAKRKRKIQFQPVATVMKYHKKTYNIFCFSSLASEFHCIDDNRDVPAFVNIIE